MKNIRIYSPKKYEGKDYKKVKENIYKTIIVPKQSDNSLTLKGVSDDNLVKILRDMDNWKECENEIEEDLLYIIYNGKKNTIKKLTMRKKRYLKMNQMMKIK